MKGFTRFDASAFLDNEGIIAEYLAAALEADNPDLVTWRRCANVARARRFGSCRECYLVGTDQRTGHHFGCRRQS